MPTEADPTLDQQLAALNLSPEQADRVRGIVDGSTAAGAETVDAAEHLQALIDKITHGNWAELTTPDWTYLAFQLGGRVALVLVILFVALTVAGWMSSAVRTSLTKMKFDPTLSKFLAKLARWGVLMLAGLSCLGYFGVETTSFAAVLGAAGFAVGLAFQGTLSNFAAGAMLLLFRPFKVGDVVNLNGQLGKVDEIELFTTSLDTFDNRRIILPNSDVFGTTIENITHHPVRRVDVEVGAAYGADLDATRATLLSAIAKCEGGLATPEPAVVLVGLGASSVDWKAQVWAPTANYLDVKQSLIRAVKQSLDGEGISIPFPQLDLHIQQPAGDASQQRAA